MPFVFSQRYYADIGIHVFPIIKYRRVYETLIAEGGISPDACLEPEPATHEQLRLAHTEAYLRDLEECAWTPRTLYSELPISEEIVELFKLSAGGTILAGRTAIEEEWAVHLCGGFHHAFADKAEGFCYINDLAVAARVLQHEGTVHKVAVIDCDLHQGNGTAVIFQGDPSVFTFSIHQRDLYPVKQQSDWDIHLPDGVGDDEYLDHLYQAIPKILTEFGPGLVLYQAGADPYREDQLGSLRLSMAGLVERDRFIFMQCKAHGVPVATTLGGGYAFNTEDTIRIHHNTCMTALQVFQMAEEGGD